MAKQYVETEYTARQIKSLIASKIANGIDQRKLESLYRIYGFNPYEPWVRVNDLLSAVDKSSSFELEEAARVLIDPYLCYGGEGKFYRYG